MSRTLVSSRNILAMAILLCTSVAALAFTGAPALAAPPEAPETKPASAVTASTATLNGVLNPDAAGESGTYEFVYRESGTECNEGQTVPEPAGIALGFEKEQVSAEVSGLLPDTQYAFCLLARNGMGEATVGSDVTFTTLAQPPTLEGESFSNVGPTSATVSARVDAGGAQTTYHVEYGTSSSYGSTTPEISVGAPTSAVGSLVQLTGLQPDTTYHFRFVARNALGGIDGGDVTLRTVGALGVSSLSLPDGRAYELVSSSDNQEAYVPTGVVSKEEDANTTRPARASSDGNAVVYMGDPPSLGVGGNGSGGAGLGNQWFATRGPEGWTTSDIQPLASNGETRFEGFSEDLSVGFIRTFVNEILTPDGPNCNGTLYSRTSGDGVFHALFASTPKPPECGEPTFAGASANDSHVLFETEAILTGEAEPASAPEGTGNLYETFDGRLRSVNVLDGKPDPNATFGGPSSSPAWQPDFNNAISADGARIFWTDLNTGKIYVRENGTSTVAVSQGAAQYWTATSDGRYVFYTEDERLWRFDVEADTRQELVGEGSGVQGVVAVSNDGSYVYFVADGVLAGNEVGEKERAAPQTCREPSGGKEEEEENAGDLKGRGCNLYVLHVGASFKFIATLAARDNNLPTTGENRFQIGDWQPDIGFRAAELSSNGHSLVFESRQPLTGYDNGGSTQRQRAVEVFVYADETGLLSCASCDPSGAAPTTKEGFEDPTWLPFSMNGTFMRRLINEDGTEVFFDSLQPLVPQDTNGVQDVYEWEREGADGSCPVASSASRSGGCLFLLSGGSSPNDAFLLDASESGGDVFFTSRGQLVPEDGDERVDVYDARVGGGFPRVSLACTGAGCQGVPPAPPIFATPSSVTFNGVGNFPPVTALTIGHKAKPKQCKRGSVRKHGKCVKKRPKKTTRAGKRSKKGRK